MFVFSFYDMIEYVGVSPAGSSKGKTKVDQEQENPDMREPSTEEDERLSSTLEYELPVDDVPVTQNTSGDQSTGERKLIRIDKRSESELIHSSLKYLGVIPVPLFWVILATQKINFKLKVTWK